MKKIISLVITKVLLIGCLLIWINGCSEDAAPVGKMPPVLKIGEVAPDFVFQSLFGDNKSEEKLSSYKGKVIYLDFWASWCKPCLISMPLLNQIRNDLVDQDFEVIAVNLDDNIENGKIFLSNSPVDYPAVATKNIKIYELYKLNGLPTSYLIDRQGVVRYSHQGFNEKDIKVIKKQILLLLR